MTPLVLAVLHPADLYRNPQLRLPSLADWSKVSRFLKGEWPTEIPPRIIVDGDDFDQAQAAIDWLSSVQGEVSCDTEFTRDTHYMTLIGFAARLVACLCGHPESYHEGRCYYGRNDGEGCLCHHDGGYRPSETVTGVQLKWPSIHWTHKQVLSAAIKEMIGRCTIIFQNTMADVPVIERSLGIPFSAYHAVEDTMLAHAILWSEMEHTLEFLASMYSPYPKQKHLAREDQLAYHWGDCIDTLAVWDGLKAELAKDSASESVYRDQSLKLIPLVLESNAKGIRVDAQRVQTASAEYHEKMSVAQSIAQAYAGWPINVGSNQHLKLWFYDIEGLPLQKNKDTKKATIDEDAIAALRGLYEPLPDLDDEAENGVSIDETLQRVQGGAHPLLEARVLYAGALQAESHYIRPAMQAVAEGDGRIYPQTKIHAQASGRHSITDPPMQQIPPDLRDIILPDEGEEWLKWDWTNIEVWKLAELSGDKKLLAAKEQRHDTHTLNFCDMFGVPYPPIVTKALHTAPECEEWRQAINWQGEDDIRRRFTKRGVFKIHYRGYDLAGTPGVKTLGLDKTKLTRLHQAYLAAHPWIVDYWRRCDRQAEETGATRTTLGRRRQSLLWQRGRPLPESAKRELSNHPLQGFVADWLNLTIIAVKAACPQARLVYSAHDAATFGYPIGLSKIYVPKIKQVVQRAFVINGREVSFPAEFKTRRSA